MQKKDSTPVDKIKSNLAALDKDSIKEKKLFVLVSTGSLNPVHRMHVEMFNVAKAHLEQQKDNIVIGGYLSPSHDYYVSGKLGVYHMPSHMRIELCNRAVQDSNCKDWLMVDQWECDQETFVNFDGVVKNVDKVLKKTLPDVTINVLYVCGADHAIRCNMACLKNFGFICCARPGSSKDVNQVAKNRGYDKMFVNNRPFYYYVPTDLEDISSTAIRQDMMTGGRKLEEFTFPSVAEYLRKYMSASPTFSKNEK
jgi:nicotinamide mononucleotide adenylyltransferase